MFCRKYINRSCSMVVMKKHIFGWILSGLSLAFLLFGTFPKFFSSQYRIEFVEFFPNFNPFFFGFLSLLAIGLYIYSKTRVIGFGLVTVYWSGAIALTWHMMGFLMALPLLSALVFLWAGFGLLRPDLLWSKK